MPVFSNFIGPNSDFIDLRHNLWNGCLPDDRISAADIPKATNNIGISYGDYFTTASTFLTENNHHNLLNALNQILESKISADAIQAVNLHLVKHGKFYHPSHVKVTANEEVFSFVLNVAVSTDGQRIIEQEYTALKRLNAEFPISFLPKVYAIGQILTPAGLPIKMFLGEWFHDFHEFHLSSVNQSNGRHVMVWNGRQDLLESRQTFELIKKACMILTFYYNPETYEHIFPWHHGAGDFVVKLENNQIFLKLISARGYVPLVESDIDTNTATININSMLDALLAFFIDMSLRMRMDRIDGVGEIAFYKDDCLLSVVSGFFQGLDLVANMREYPGDFCSAVKTYFNAIRSEDLVDLTHACVSRYMSFIGNEALMRLDVSKHVRSLRKALSHINNNRVTRKPKRITK